jgi:hypothetical protein
MNAEGARLSLVTIETEVLRWRNLGQDVKTAHLAYSGTVILPLLDLCDGFPPHLYIYIVDASSGFHLHYLHSHLLALSLLPRSQHLRCLLLRCDGSLKIA